LESLSREVLFRKEDSLRGRIFNLVLSTLQEAKDAEAEKLLGLPKALYDLRSDLVHKGSCPGTHFPLQFRRRRHFVQRVLRARGTLRV